jgi:hypothetical protein
MSAAGTIGLGINSLVICGLCIIFGKVIDIFVFTANMLSLPQDALNVIGYLIIGFYAFGIIYLLALIVNHIIVTNNETSGVR